MHRFLTAFDKGDLLYLRDEAERQRHAELELRDSEKTQFAALRAKFEQQDGQTDVIRIARKDKSSGRWELSLVSSTSCFLSSACWAGDCRIHCADSHPRQPLFTNGYSVV